MDRNDRARLMWRAEAYERKTKGRALPSGALGYTGISLLRVIAFRYWSAPKRAAWPSYDELQRVTGYCRQTIARALRRLEAAGFLLVQRRAGWRQGRIVRETNLYRLPADAPCPAESLPRERQPKTQDFVPYAALTGPLKDALERLAERLGLDKSGLAGT